ncbi:hypothetical protein B0T24DRAFT_647132 [Lasiosphaeria ovina]|uniref:FluG domain-containing protein n=1 Tax=Lasiosphaeria ovina TaxID=92902 RepID=A0AAE0NDN3_9PEZI|nr:hypothetical protein B0T24DRAFT_647132 [Lasiosphaeria ovina]
MLSGTMAVHRRPTAANGVLNHHADFLNSITTQEAHNRELAKRRPAPLSAEEHAAHRTTLEGVSFIRRNYAPGTEINISDWRDTIKSLPRATIQDFFLWVCENHNIKSRGTSQQYIRQLQLLYTQMTGNFPNRNDMKERSFTKYEMLNLIPFRPLKTFTYPLIPVLNVDSLRVILTFNIAYDAGISPLERQRLHMAGCYMIICYTGARPAELVDNEKQRPKYGSIEQIFGSKAIMSAGDSGAVDDQGKRASEEVTNEDSSKLDRLLLQETIGRGRPKALCYEDIQMLIIRDPATGRERLAMSIKFIHHKGCDNMPKPYHLIFCPVLLFLSLALSDGAFDADSLKDASSVPATKIPPGKDCLPLRWKKSKLKIPFFRRAFRGGILSEDEAMQYSILRDNMARQSLEAGFEKAWAPRFGRRGAANAANMNAPDAVRDQMLRHDPKFFTFQSAYLNEVANFDLQNAFLEEETEDQLFRLFAHVSLTRDPRATRDMVPAEVWTNLPPDPEIASLEEERAKLKQGQYRLQGYRDEAKIRQLTDMIRSKRAQRDKRIVLVKKQTGYGEVIAWLEQQTRKLSGHKDVDCAALLRVVKSAASTSAAGVPAKPWWT